jgi:hypothetical protein
MTSDGSVSIEELGRVTRQLGEWRDDIIAGSDHRWPPDIIGLINRSINAIATLQRSADEMREALSALTEAADVVQLRLSDDPNEYSDLEEHRALNDLYDEMGSARAALKALPPQQDAAEVSSCGGNEPS